MPDDSSPPPVPRPVIPLEETPPPQAAAPAPPDGAGAEGGGTGAGGPVPPMTVAEPGVMAPAPFAQVYSAPAAPTGYYPPPAYPPPAYPPRPEARDMGAQAVALGLPSQSRLSPPTTTPSAYPPPLPVASPQGDAGATYPPPAYPPPATYPPAPGYPPPAFPPPAGYSPAWPGAQVDYRTAGTGQYSRPGFVTTLAVFSIITAALSLLASAFTGCTGLVVLTSAQRGGVFMGGTGARVAPPAVAVAPGQTAGPQQSPNGLSAAEVSVVSSVARNKAARPLSPERRKQLDAFLAEHGKLVLDDPAGMLTSRKVYDHLGATGQEYARPGETGAHFFQFKEGAICKLPGRLRVFDDRAVFDPDDHSTTLRSAAKADSAPGDAGDAFVDPGLGDEAALAVVNQVRIYSRNMLNPAQAATLRTTLQSPAYTAWVTPASTAPGMASQVKSVVVNADRSMTIAFTTTQVTLDAQGNVVGGAPPLPGGAAGVPAAGGPAATMPAGVVFGAIGVNKTHCALAIGEAALSAALAVFLLVVAILCLRQSPGVRRLYLIYAVAKLICAVVGIVAFAGILRSLSAGKDTMGYAQAMAQGFGGMAKAALTVTAIGLVLPLVVLLVMTMSRTAKDYFKASA